MVHRSPCSVLDGVAQIQQSATTSSVANEGHAFMVSRLRILVCLFGAICGYQAAIAQVEDIVVRRIPVVSNGGVLSVTASGKAWFTPAAAGGPAISAYGGSQKVLNVVPVAGGALAHFSGGGVYFSPDGTHLGGTGQSVRVYYGPERVAALAAANGGVVTLFANGRAFFSPDGRNLDGGGATVSGYAGKQSITGLVEVPGGVKAEFSGGGIYFSSTGTDLGGSGASVRTPAWNKLTGAATFARRDSAVGLKFRNQYWVSGGFYQSPTWSYSDLWATDTMDFSNWSLMAGVAEPSLTAPGNIFEPYSQFVQFNGQLLAIGSTVWTSADGKDWSIWSTNGPTTATEDFAAFVLPDRVVALRTDLGIFSTSADGKSWSAAMPIPGFAKRCGAAAFSAAGRIWVMGGATCDYQVFLNDIWYSDDGQNWVRATSPSSQRPATVPWAPRMWPATCSSSDGTMWAIGGYWSSVGAGANLSDVWYSRDGLNWSRLAVNSVIKGVSLTPRHAALCIADEDFNRLLIIAGKGGTNPLNKVSTVLNDVWALELPRVRSLTVLPESWPPYVPDPAWAQIGADAAAEYNRLGYTYQRNLQNYSVSGDYVNLGVTDQWRETSRIRFDENGVPQVMYGDTFYYNPVTTAEFALSMHGRFLKGLEPDLSKFWAGVARLQNLQGPDGALRYGFEFPYYLTGQSFQPGWVSGMAQGMALSVYARAYLLTGDKKYIAAGNAVLKFMLSSVSSGGTTIDLRYLDASLSRSVMYDEYPWLPSGYTLNGFMFAMLGVYDWMQMPAVGNTAQDSFSLALHTLRNVLPYYEIGGFSAYDMGHLTYGRSPHIGISYHAVHVYLLHALASITRDETLMLYEKKFAEQVLK